MRALDWALLSIVVLAGVAAFVISSQVCVVSCEQGADCSWTGCGVQNPYFWVSAGVAIAAGVALVVRLRR
jgi:hypothetical protein